MPEIIILYGDDDKHPISFDSEKVLAASKAFPYWTFWSAPDKDNKTSVRFISMDYIREVTMIGEAEEAVLASVTPLRQEEDDDLGSI